METTPHPFEEISRLTACLAKGDEAAFRHFFGLYGNRLLRYLLVLTRGKEDAAKEAMQLTLVRVARHMRTFDSEDAFWSWLTVLARSAALDEGRKHRRFAGLLQRFFVRVQPESFSHPGNSDDDLVSLLEANLKQLPPDEQQLVERKYFSSQSVSEIAGDLQSTEKAIESRLVRIRRKLKETILRQLNDQSYD
ncbi:MAG: sigma-70 family RNA polymerase sigma factor [Verrucomicrobia bacterium]|nr:sigma-70 family RNA polymerase sigma factor [Verrucomicrobiota bacterium]